MTPKLLTLEEIEKTNKEYTAIFFLEPKATAGAIEKELLLSLLATARAYWELVDIEDTNDNKLDALPHLPTLKVIVEAMKVIEKSNARLTDIHIVSFRNGIQSLEKHLE